MTEVITVSCCPKRWTPAMEDGKCSVTMGFHGQANNGQQAQCVDKMDKMLLTWERGLLLIA